MRCKGLSMSLKLILTCAYVCMYACLPVSLHAELDPYGHTLRDRTLIPLDPLAVCRCACAHTTCRQKTMQSYRHMQCVTLCVPQCDTKCV